LPIFARVTSGTMTKQRHICILLIILFLNSCTADKYWQQPYGGLKGKVESVSEKLYPAVMKNGEILKVPEIMEEYCQTFDNDGLQKSYSTVSADRRQYTFSCYPDSNVITTTQPNSGQPGENMVRITEKLTTADRKKKKWTATNPANQPVYIKTVHSEWMSNFRSTVYESLQGEPTKSMLSFFDKHHRLTEYKEYIGDTVYFLREYHYDENLLTKKKMCNRLGEELYTYEYTKFDKHNNWTERIVYVDGKLHAVSEQMIKYRE